MSVWGVLMNEDSDADSFYAKAGKFSTTLLMHRKHQKDTSGRNMQHGVKNRVFKPSEIEFRFNWHLPMGKFIPTPELAHSEPGAANNTIPFGAGIYPVKHFARPRARETRDRERRNIVQKPY